MEALKRSSRPRESCPTRARSIRLRSFAVVTTAVALAWSAAAPDASLGASRATSHPARSILLVPGTGYRSIHGSRLVRALQRRLAMASYGPGPIDGRYGPLTSRAVVGFQLAHGLAADGIVGPLTWAALRSPNPVVLWLGARSQSGGSDLVRRLQRRLAAAGDSPGPIDGRYGWLTERAVRRFQAADGLRIDGAAGPRTLGLALGRSRSVRGTRGRSGHVPKTVGSTPATGSRPRASARATGRLPTTRTGAPWVAIGWALAMALTLGLLLYLRTRGRGHPAPISQAGPNSKDRFAPQLQLVAPEHGGAGASAIARPDSGRDSRRDSRRDGAAETVGGRDGAAARVSRRDGAEEAFDLGVQLEQRGNMAGAEAAYRRADQAGHAAAASNLGVLLEQDGALREAEAAYRRADQRGDATAALNLGMLLESRGDLAEAEAAYRRANQRGNGAAASNLGVLLEERGALAEAEDIYRRADRSGDATAAFNLAALLEERGELLEAEGAYARAEHQGNAAVANIARAARVDLRDHMQEW
jgi:peptidoglycan hydrolase-like protein with peptidoglycan-binding domain/Flp pilus assembly protein TadD